MRPFLFVCASLILALVIAVAYAQAADEGPILPGLDSLPPVVSPPPSRSVQPAGEPRPSARVSGTNPGTPDRPVRAPQLAPFGNVQNNNQSVGERPQTARDSAKPAPRQGLVPQQRTGAADYRPDPRQRPSDPNSPAMQRNRQKQAQPGSPASPNRFGVSSGSGASKRDTLPGPSSPRGTTNAGRDPRTMMPNRTGATRDGFEGRPPKSQVPAQRTQSSAPKAPGNGIRGIPERPGPPNAMRRPTRG